MGVTVNIAMYWVGISSIHYNVTTGSPRFGIESDRVLTVKRTRSVMTGISLAGIQVDKFGGG